MTCEYYLRSKEFTVNSTPPARHFNLSSCISGNLSCLLSVDLHRPSAHQILYMKISNLCLMSAHNTPPLVSYYTYNHYLIRYELPAMGNFISTVAAGCGSCCRVTLPITTNNNYPTTTDSFRLSLPCKLNFSLQEDRSEENFKS